MRRWLAAPVAQVLCLVSASAVAEPGAGAAPPLGSKPGSELSQLTTWRPSGLAFTVGGGPGTFASTAMRDRTTGAATVYEVRGVFGTNSPVAIELAHFGMVQRFDVVDDGVRLLALGLESDVRVNLLGAGAVQPFIAAGVGWTHLNLLAGIGDTVGDDDRKNAVHFPVGAGIAFFFRDFVFDLRALARLTPEDENKLFEAIDQANLSTWSATAQIGWHIP